MRHWLNDRVFCFQSAGRVRLQWPTVYRQTPAVCPDIDQRLRIRCRPYVCNLGCLQYWPGGQPAGRHPASNIAQTGRQIVCTRRLKTHVVQTRCSRAVHDREAMSLNRHNASCMMTVEFSADCMPRSTEPPSTDRLTIKRLRYVEQKITTVQGPTVRIVCVCQTEGPQRFAVYNGQQSY